MKRRIQTASVTLLLGLIVGVVFAHTPTAGTYGFPLTHGVEVAAPVPAEVKCPVCGSSAYFTGTTKTDVSGKLLKLYQCMRFTDHKFWVVAN